MRCAAQPTATKRALLGLLSNFYGFLHSLADGWLISFLLFLLNKTVQVGEYHFSPFFSSLQIAGRSVSLVIILRGNHFCHG
jgi:hypothetical protein